MKIQVYFYGANECKIVFFLIIPLALTPKQGSNKCNHVLKRQSKKMKLKKKEGLKLKQQGQEQQKQKQRQKQEEQQKQI